MTDHMHRRNALGRVAEANGRLHILKTRRARRVQTFADRIESLDVDAPYYGATVIRAALDFSEQTTILDSAIAKAETDLALWKAQV